MLGIVHNFCIIGLGSADIPQAETPFGRQLGPSGKLGITVDEFFEIFAVPHIKINGIGFIEPAEFLFVGAAHIKNNLMGAVDHDCITAG